MQHYNVHHCIFTDGQAKVKHHSPSLIHLRAHIIHACLACSVTGLEVQPQDVAVVVTGEDSSGSPKVTIYVKPNNTGFLFQSSLAEALLVWTQYTSSVYSCEAEDLVTNLFPAGIFSVLFFSRLVNTTSTGTVLAFYSMICRKLYFLKSYTHFFLSLIGTVVPLIAISIQ